MPVKLRVPGVRAGHKEGPAGLAVEVIERRLEGLLKGHADHGHPLRRPRDLPGDPSLPEDVQRRGSRHIGPEAVGGHEGAVEVEEHGIEGKSVHGAAW